ncbi:MAG: repair protein RadA [Pseudomonadota bacterium]
MAKEKTIYVCTECAGTAPKWLGKCPSCNAWNTLVESVADNAAPAKNRFASLAKSAEVATLGDIDAVDMQRTPTGHEELDRVLGGGMVEGGVVLIGGDPGVGLVTAQWAKNFICNGRGEWCTSGAAFAPVGVAQFSSEGHG